MFAVEIIQVRLFDVNDGAKVVDAFNRVVQQPHPFHVTLYQNARIGNDWSICYWKPNTTELDLKLPEAIGLAESLRSIGLVDHSLWLPVPLDPSDGRKGMENMVSETETPVAREVCP